jgi:hypothetical protein
LLLKRPVFPDREPALFVCTVLGLPVIIVYSTVMEEFAPEPDILCRLAGRILLYRDP